MSPASRPVGLKRGSDRTPIMRIYRYAYDDGWRPYFQTDAAPLSLAPGQVLSVPLSPETFCLGYTRQGVRRACVKNATGKKQCAFCAKEDDFLLCLRCDGATCLQFTDGLKNDCFGKDYSVYLAAFGQHIKAGVSKTERLQKRWVEQGADYAPRVFGGVNGQDARVIESALVRSGLLARLTLGQKMELPQADGTVMDDELQSDSFRRVAETFAKNAVPSPRVESMQGHYPAIASARPTEYLQGTVLGAKGPVLFLEQNGAPRAFGLPNAVGRKILTNTLAAFA